MRAVREPLGTVSYSLPATAQRHKPAQNLGVGDVSQPTVRGGDSPVKGLARVSEPRRRHSQRADLAVCNTVLVTATPSVRLPLPRDGCGRVEPSHLLQSGEQG